MVNGSLNTDKFADVVPFGHLIDKMSIVSHELNMQIARAESIVSHQPCHSLKQSVKSRQIALLSQPDADERHRSITWTTANAFRLVAFRRVVIFVETVSQYLERCIQFEIRKIVIHESADRNNRACTTVGAPLIRALESIDRSLEQPSSQVIRPAIKVLCKGYPGDA